MRAKVCSPQTLDSASICGTPAPTLWSRSACHHYPCPDIAFGHAAVELLKSFRFISESIKIKLILQANIMIFFLIYAFRKPKLNAKHYLKRKSRRTSVKNAYKKQLLNPRPHLSKWCSVSNPVCEQLEGAFRLNSVFDGRDCSDFAMMLFLQITITMH